jgi:hypothetical protein
MPNMQNPATMGGAHCVGDLLGGDQEQTTASPLILQISRLVSRFGMPTATAATVAEIVFYTETRG